MNQTPVQLEPDALGFCRLGPTQLFLQLEPVFGDGPDADEPGLVERPDPCRLARQAFHAQDVRVVPADDAVPRLAGRRQGPEQEGAALRVEETRGAE
jgi:hypothetical protein